MELSNTTYDGKPIAPTPQPEPRHEPGHWFDVVSNWVSWVMVPLLMPVYGLAMMFNFSLMDFLDFQTKCIFSLINFGINFVLPLLIFYGLFKLKLVSDIGLNERKERWIPYLVTIGCMGYTAIFFAQKGAPTWMYMFYAGGAASAAINLVVNFRWKISAHAAGMAGVLAILVRMAQMGLSPHPMLGWIIVWTLLLGLVGTCRVWLGRHTVWQVMAGYAVGFACVYLLTLIN